MTGGTLVMGSPPAARLPEGRKGAGPGAGEAGRRGAGPGPGGPTGFGAGWTAEAGGHGAARPGPATGVTWDIPHGSLWTRGLRMAEAEIDLGLDPGGRWRTSRGRPARPRSAEMEAAAEAAPVLAA